MSEKDKAILEGQMRLSPKATMKDYWCSAPRTLNVCASHPTRFCEGCFQSRYK
jgi:hypothetical protein